MLVSATDYLSSSMIDFLSEQFPDRSAEVFSVQLNEFLKFMILISLMSKSFIPLTKEIDEIWHECILQTGEYHKLCGRLPGERYIHHQSISLERYSQKYSKDWVIHGLLEWIPAYVHSFGPFEESVAHYWMICNFLRRELGLSLQEINRLGLEENPRVVAH